MDTKARLEHYFEEAKRHITRIESVLPDLRIYVGDAHPVVLNGDVLDKCDVLAFRFAKLQDLAGAKIFRLFLAYLGYPVEGQDFLTLLRELEKESFIDMDRWVKLRGIRNALAHDYPEEEEMRLAAVKELLDEVTWLIEVVRKMERIVCD